MRGLASATSAEVGGLPEGTASICADVAAVEATKGGSLTPHSLTRTPGGLHSQIGRVTALALLSGTAHRCIFLGWAAAAVETLARCAVPQLA